MRGVRGELGGGVGDSLPDVAYAVALSRLGAMTPRRLRLLLGLDDARTVLEGVVAGDPELAERLCRLGGAVSPQSLEGPLDMEENWGISGSPECLRHAEATARSLLRRWQKEVTSINVSALWRDLGDRGMTVVRRGRPPYPNRLLRAREAPELLYVRGSIEVAVRPCVGIVGTRRATHYGLGVAGELGHELARYGVVVVSGLARGIDAEALRGALAAGATAPVGVVGGGLDVIDPSALRRLFDEVSTAGALVSEAPPGTSPDDSCFSLCQRVVAAMSQVLVVVESSWQGSPMHTVAAADSCGVPVLAVPGSIRSPQSGGTNAIIQDGGAGVACHPDDVLAALSLICLEDGTPLPGEAGRRTGEAGARTGEAGALGMHRRGRRVRPSVPAICPEQLDPAERAVLQAVDDVGTSTDTVCLRTKLELGTVALILDRLEELGALRSEGAAWVRN